MDFKTSLRQLFVFKSFDKFDKFEATLKVFWSQITGATALAGLAAPASLFIEMLFLLRHQALKL